VFKDLQEHLRVRHGVVSTARAARLMEHGETFAALPVLDPWSSDEIIGYDEVGLSR
jgi:hypothetical protein